MTEKSRKKKISPIHTRSHELVSAAHGGRAATTTLSVRARKTKVADLALQVVVQEKVLALQIAEDDVPGVQVGHAASNVEANLKGPVNDEGSDETQREVRLVPSLSSPRRQARQNRGGIGQGRP